MNPTKLLWPVDKSFPITQLFGENPDSYTRFKLNGHNGIDIAVPVGTPVCAADDGVIDRISTDPAGYGLYVRIKHAWGISLYGHFSAVVNQQGDNVAGGQMFAKSGNSGNSTGPHVHFEIRPDSEPKTNGYNGAVDPMPYLQQTQVTINTSQVLENVETKLAVVKSEVRLRSTPEINSTNILLLLPEGLHVGIVSLKIIGKNTWACLGRGLWCAMVNAGYEYLEYAKN